jgi:phospholipid/cholesterol/gamma-HCH transport system substrate-binding protein
MENRAHALLAGLFVLLMGAALAVTIAWFQGDSVERMRYVVVARSAVSGLNVKAPVKLRGVEVGKVESIGFDPADARQILVLIAVDKAAPLTRGTYAQLGLQGVTGLSFIDLSDTGADPARPAGDPPRIELRPTLFDQLANAGPGLLASVHENARRVNQLLGDANQAELARSLARLGTAADDVSRLAAALQPTAKALPGLLSHADGLLRRGEGTLARIDALAADGSLLAQDLRTRAAALERLGAAAAQLEGSTRRLELSLVGPTPLRQKPLLDELAGAGRALEQAAGGLAERPQSLLFGRPAPPPGPGEPGFDSRWKAAP